MDKLKRFIDIHIPISTCNLRCPYCYVPQAQKYGSEELRFPYSPSRIRQALSVSRLEGLCLFNICGMGETLIPHETIDITKELLDEGHYVTIVTNGLLTKRLEDLAALDKNKLDRLLFKFSLHYTELLRLNKLQAFADNVRLMRKAGASITVELTANDFAEPYINDIIRYTEGEFGAKCHISIPRDETSIKFALQSKHTLDEFYKIWRVFDSALLDFKFSIWGEKRKEYCYAGEWSGLLNVQNGEWRSCYHQHFSCNIFENISNPIPFVPVGRHCNVSHCFNGHSWLTLGDIPGINSHTYADMRDRVCCDGTQWLTKSYRDFISQRLDKNHENPHHLVDEIKFKEMKAICYAKKLTKKLLKTI